MTVAAGPGRSPTMRSRPQHAATTYVVLGVLAMLAACGGGGGDSNPPAGGGGSTTFTGNLRPPSASLAADAHSLGAVSAVQVCVAGTNFCTEVDDTGAFTLDANVGGDVVLVFEGPDFSARLALDNVPRGATVRIRDIVCNTATGRCAAQNV